MGYRLSKKNFFIGSLLDVVFVIACPDFCDSCSVADDSTELLCDTCQQAYILNDMNCGRKLTTIFYTWMFK